MAKYTVSHTCGHTQQHNLVGKESERSRRLAWLRTTECYDCYRAAKRATEEAAAERAAATLPAIVLEGSEKQVAWATKIRVAKLDALRVLLVDRAALVSACISAPLLGPDLAQIGATHGTRTADRILAVMAAEASAKWWIDHRDLSVDDLLVIGADRAKLA